MLDAYRHLKLIPRLLLNSRLPVRSIVAFRDARLRELVRYAYDHVPFYRDLYRSHGIHPRDIRTAADLAKLPIVSRKDLQMEPPERVVAGGIDFSRLIVRRTSGSSGRPQVLRRTWFEERLQGVLRQRTLHMIGYRPSDRQVAVMLPRPPQAADSQPHMKLLNAFGLCRSQIVDCLQDEREILRQLRALRPDMLIIYPGVLARLSESMDDADRRCIRPRFINTGGEVLTAWMRGRAQAAFSAPVREIYAAHEFSVLAWECAATGHMHTCDDGVIVEVLKDGRPAAAGERGEVVATNLHSFAMPILRYRLGDIVTRGADTCPCGAPWGIISSIQGRMVDYLSLPGGRMLHPYEVSLALLRGPQWVQQFQVVQERRDHVVLNAVPLGTPAPQVLEDARRRIQAVLGPEVHFHIELAAEIPQEPSGKFRVFRSLVRSEYQNDEATASRALEQRGVPS